MNGAAEPGSPPLMIRREAYIQLGLGALALAAAAFVTRLLLLDRVSAIVWIGVIGAVALAAVFLWEGWHAYQEYVWLREGAGSGAATTVVGLQLPGPNAGEAYRGRLLVVLLFGVVASVSAPGLNVLVRIMIARRTDEIDLVVWVLLVLPICLAVWMLPPRGLGPCSEDSRHRTLGSPQSLSVREPPWSTRLPSDGPGLRIPWRQRAP